MEKIVSFEKEIKLHTLINDITSISLDNDLNINNNEINGNFTITGSYTISGESDLEENINEVIPCTIAIDKKYNTSKASIIIDDFRYKISNDSLLINIDVLLKDLEIVEVLDSEEEQAIIDEINGYDERNENEEIEDIGVDEEIDSTVFKLENNDVIKEPVLITDKEPTLLDPKLANNNTITNVNINQSSKDVDDSKFASIFATLANAPETFVKYHVYIVRGEDSIESVINKYKTTRDILTEYNDLENVVTGTKLIIPNINE